MFRYTISTITIFVRYFICLYNETRSMKNIAFVINIQSEKYASCWLLRSAFDLKFNMKAIICAEEIIIIFCYRYEIETDAKKMHFVYGLI